MRSKKTPKMLEVEERLCSPIEELLPALLEDGTIQETATAMGISKSVLGYWMLRFGVRLERVVLRPGQRAVVLNPGEKVISGVDTDD